MLSAGISAAASLSRSKPVSPSTARRCIRAGISSDNSSSNSSVISAACAHAREPSLAACSGQRPDSEDVGGPLGHADHTARIEKVEEMARFEALVVGGQGQSPVDQPPALVFGIGEMRDKPGSVGKLEIIGGEFPLGALEDFAVGDASGPADAVVVEIEDARDTLYIHRQPLEPISQLGRNGIAFKTADLLEIGELADLHAVEPNFPSKPPGAQGRAFPIVLDEANVVQTAVDADGREALEVEVLAVRRRRLQ